MSDFVIDKKGNPNSAKTIERAREFIANLPADKKWQVTVKPYRFKRTNSQNNYLWAVVYKTIVDNDAGFFVNDATDTAIRGTKIKHTDLVHEFFKQRLLSIGSFGKTAISRSTSELSTKEFTEYVEEIMRVASIELGIYIPTPAEQGMTDYQKWWGK